MPSRIQWKPVDCVRERSRLPPVLWMRAEVKYTPGYFEIHPELDMRILLSALIILFAATVSADPIEGKWRATSFHGQADAVIEVVPCRRAFCAKIVGQIEADGGLDKSHKRVGQEVFKGMKADGSGRYSGGHVFSYDEQRWFQGKLRLVRGGSKMDVWGCQGGTCGHGAVFTRMK